MIGDPVVTVTSPQIRDDRRDALLERIATAVESLGGVGRQEPSRSLPVNVTVLDVDAAFVANLIEQIEEIRGEGLVDDSALLAGVEVHVESAVRGDVDDLATSVAVEADDPGLALANDPREHEECAGQGGGVAAQLDIVDLQDGHMNAPSVGDSEAATSGVGEPTVGEATDAGESPSPASVAPSPFCEIHPRGTWWACGGCAEHRRVYGIWLERTYLAPMPMPAPLLLPQGF